MEKTTNLKLNKPTMADFVSESVEKVFGDNLDILDAVISAVQTAQNSHADNKSNPHSVKFDQTIEQLAAGADLNDISDGMFFFRNNTVNAPVTGTGLVLQASPGSGARFQMAVHDMTSTTCIYQRYKATTGWSEWKNSYMSPAFTGTPTAPTAESGTSTTQIATTAFVAAAIAAIQITKEAVGLGNVPNVTTNDQTPTYTAASALATLVSGEKLSVSMGKIMLAITNLISHLANTSNPHSVTLAQLGAAAASHKHSASDISSGTLPASRGGTGKTSLSALATAIFASPAFTGVPTAPTAESGTNTSQVATTAFVQQESAKDWFFIAEHNGASDNLYSSNTATVSDISQVNNFNNLAITVTYSGTIRISALLNYTTTSTRYIYLSVYKNGSLQKTFYNNGNSGAQTQNINISKGDILTFEYGFVSATSGNPSTGSARFDLLGVLNKRSSTGLSISES